MRNAGILALGASLVLAGCGSSYVQQGHVGLLVDNFTGRIDKVLEPGYRLAIPIGQHIIQYPMLKQQYVMVMGIEGQRSGEDDSVKVNSSEGQTFNVDASVEFMIHDKPSVGPLYQKYAMNFDDIVEKYYRSKFRAAITNSFASLPLAEGITGDGRKKVEDKAEAELRNDLADDHIEVLKVLVRAVHIPEQIATSIAEKTRAENDLVKARTVAQQKVVEAEAEARANIARAEGQAKAKLIMAESEAKANQVVSSSLTDRLLRKLYVDKLADKVQLVLPEKSFFNFGGLVPGANGAEKPEK